MKHTGNQKVVTALLSESLYKGSYLPHIRLVLPYLIGITIQNRGLWRVAIGFTDFKSGLCPFGYVATGGLSFLLLLFVVLGCVANVRMQRSLPPSSK